MILQTDFIVENGVLIDRCPCDVDEHGDIKSNGSQEFMYRYMGETYCVWMNWDDQPIRPNEMLSPLETNDESPYTNCGAK